jgi:nitrite reductase/ring-hydroxylating ferredoxin subunit
MDDELTWITVAARHLLADGEMIGARLGDRDIVIYNVGGEFYATDNICTHAFALLSEGWLEDGVVECPLHGGKFDVKTGKALEEPAIADLEVLPVRVVGDEVQVGLAHQPGTS